MYALLFSADAWIALVTLAALEIVLGIDNIIFLAVVANKVEPAERPTARRIGLILALAMRIGLLSSVAWIITLSTPIVAAWGIGLSWRDFVFGAGGIFLLTKSTREIHDMAEGDDAKRSGVRLTLVAAIIQIAL